LLNVIKKLKDDLLAEIQSLHAMVIPGCTFICSAGSGGGFLRPRETSIEAIGAASPPLSLYPCPEKKYIAI